MARTISALINDRVYDITFHDVDDEEVNYISASFAHEIQNSNITIKNYGFFT